VSTAKITKLEQEARERYEGCVQKMDETDSRIQALPEDCPEEERKLLEAIFENDEEDTARAKQTWERQTAISRARQLVPAVDEGDDEQEERGNSRSRLSVKEPLVYSPESRNSFFRDLAYANLPDLRDAEAESRIALHGKQMLVEKRDVTTADPGAAAFIPPLYMGEEWIDKAIAGRPFADAVPKIPLSPVGKTMDFPRVATAPTADVQAAEGDAANETDLDGETYSVNKVTIAGQNDVSLQTLEFSDPSIDTVIMRELVKNYNAKLDYQMIYGTGANGQHRGIKTVVVSDSGNTESFTTGGADELLGKIYSAVSQVATNAPGYEAQTILLHPRRAAWMASHRDANGNLFQQGQLFLASGDQNAGFVGNVAGLRVIRDSNILTTLSTSQDDAYVLDIDELMLAEGPLRTRVMAEVLSGTLQVRIQLYAFSAFAGGRRPKVITRISGAGLTTPSFPST
jgi:HK97 family phage major capsid protein